MLTGSPGWRTASYCNAGGCVEIGVWAKAGASNPNGSCVEIGAWNTASHSFANHNCVEAGAWGKASMSSHNGGCVEVAAWNKARASTGNGDCVETGAWSKAEASSYNGSCVEVMAEDDLGEMSVHVRDTKDRTIPPVVFGLNAWTEFIRRINAGEFPLTDADEYRVGHLAYTRGEWEAFLDGAGKGEFDLSPELAAMAAG